MSRTGRTPEEWSDLQKSLVDMIQAYAEDLHGGDAARRLARPRSRASEDIVYGEINGSLVFIPRARTVLLSEIRYFVHQSQEAPLKWGELRAQASCEAYEEFLKQWRPATEEAGLPNPTGKVYLDEDAIADGDWPAWPAQEMLDWMPTEIIRAFGAIEYSAVSGPFLWIDPTVEDDVVGELQRLGFQPRRDQALVSKASGYL